jgi:uncharacterized protein YigE (DUF2233 family)
MRVLALVALLAALAASPARAEEGPCQPVRHGGADYTVCAFAKGEAGLRTYWLDEVTGVAFGGLSAFATAAGGRGETIAMAMNGGMYHADMRPVGLYIENGRELAKLSTTCGRQNFNMCPNGVFFVKDGAARVMETRRFRRERPKADFATQSGPMLVIEGKLHPRFRAESDSRKIRNGVGVRPDGTVLFAISDDYVTFHEFALLFRDTLGAPNALFLDGTISSLHAPSVGRADSFWPVGPIIAVTRPGS